MQVQLESDNIGSSPLGSDCQEKRMVYIIRKSTERNSGSSPKLNNKGIPLSTPFCYKGGKMREAYREFGASRSLFCFQSKNALPILGKIVSEL